ncbi:MAG: cytochrome b/b6 domain-containing protein, partial [Dehalococcoidales bacterium]|nr:cytochrome b/b6 domain-containing protein [Dehalococcoidales bacterium]
TIAETIPLDKQNERVEKITRFDVHQIVQHAGLMVSFILLVITGLPLKFHDSAISQWWAGILGGIETTRTIHHLAAYMMVLVCIYHGIYLWYTIGVLKRPFPVKMIPSVQDFAKLFQEMQYFTGLRKEKPQFDRFNWREKMDYWAIFWGMPIMAGSGFVLMYPVSVTEYLPGWVVPASLIAHSDEAMLALSWIFMVHIFFNHFTPGVFPINTSIFTGKVPKERYQREHPLEYKELTQTVKTAVAEEGQRGIEISA